jgi:hypothetical protein
LIPKLRGACILGFHLAGLNGKTYGASGLLTRGMVDDAVAHLADKGVLQAHSTGEMVTEKYGINFDVVSEPHTKSPVHWLQDEEDGTQPICQVFGQHAQPIRHFKSEVRESPISKLVEEELGLPNKHGKPQDMNSWRHWQRDLDLMSKPRGMFRPKIMKKARTDLKIMIDKILDEQPDLEKLIHPYSLDAVLAGVDGVNSVDRVDLSTSMGWPINKQKKNFIRESFREVEGISCPLDMDEQFLEEMVRMEQCLLRGERVHTIFRANLKDEPTKLTKNKVRVFAGCEFAFLLLVRKYYLSLVRVMQKNWEKFECAVGIVAQGPDWTKLANHLTKYGSERMIAGDYSAYDKRASPEVMMASFDVMIHIAKRAGYNDKQLTIMKGIATEICCPIYEYNGVYVNMLGSNPSGHPLTVIVNNLSNSLYMRYTYYAMHEGERVPLFHERIALMCYGDDNAMGVHPEEKKFNHTSVMNELAKCGIKYTMADKEAESIPYIPFSDVTFLKRAFRWDEELQQWIAPIEELSISKSLHNYMHRKNSPALPEQIAADAIVTQATEYWRWGREVYEKRRPQLQRVAERAGLTAMTGLLPTYEELQDAYRGLKKKKSIFDEPDTAVFE